MTELDQRQIDAAITAFFIAHGKGWKALARQKRWLVEGMVAIDGLAVLDRLSFDFAVDCPCCIEEDERRLNLSWMKSAYRQRRRGRNRR